MSAMAGASPWTVMIDGALFGTFNHQGGPRGVDEVKSTNWLMAMATRPAASGILQVTGMVSLDAATAGGNGYGELFQAGETHKGALIVDRQHPHDALMQASVAWRVPLGDSTALTITGAPVGEPALGPTAFMHRASAADVFAAPLSHHTLDSTHIAMGVLSAGVERGRWTLESSVFHGGEPDDNRWDLMDPGALDSWSVRAWLRPSSTWQLQASHGLLTAPETLEPGNVRRTTVSAEWSRTREGGWRGATLAYGRNDKARGDTQAFLAEATESRGPLSVFGRFERLQVETAVLAGPAAAFDDGRRDPVSAGTVGAVWDVPPRRGIRIGLGVDGTFYRVPAALEPTHGVHPASVHVFVRLRPVAAPMWGMRMGRVSAEHHHH